MRTLRRQIQEARVSLHNQFWQSKALQFEYVKMEKNFELMMKAFNMNQKLIQTYINIVKGKIKVKASSMQTIYKLLSQNKTNQIIFEKFSEAELISYKHKQEEEKAAHAKIENHKILMGNKMKNSKTHNFFQQDKNSQQIIQNVNQQKVQEPQQQKKNSWLQRAYSRLAQKMVSKITVYILRKSVLTFIAPLILEQSKKLQILMRRINDLKDLRFYYQFIDKIYEENSIFEEKIYKQIVQKGYVLSLQQFYRVNGVQLLQHKASVKRISRQSFSTNSFQSIVTFQKSQQKENVHMRTLAKLKQQKKTGKKQASNHQKKNNPLFLTKMNKQIQSKYADLLDKISDFIETKKSKNQNQNQNQKNGKLNDMNNDKIQQSLSSIQSQENEQGQWPKNAQDKNRLFRFREGQKPVRVKSNQIQFKYFSSQFSKIIKDLDDKKGKTFKKNSGQDPFGQTLKVNTDAIAYRNPENIAKLLMNGLNLNGGGRNVSKIIQKDKNYSVKRLLKLYQARNTENHVVDLILNCKITQLETKIQKQKQRQRYSKRYSNINVGILKRLQGLIQKSASNRSGHEELELLNLQKRHRKKINLNKFKNRMSNKLSKTERQSISQYSQKSSKSPRQQKMKQNLKKSNFYTTPIQQETNTIIQNNNQLVAACSQKTFQQLQNQMRSSDKVIKLLKQKAKFGVPQNAFKQFKNPLNESCGFYCDKKYDIIKKNIQKKQKMYEIFKSSSKTSFRNNKLIKKGIFKVISEKQSKPCSNQKLNQQKEKRIKLESLQLYKKSRKINGYQKFVQKNKIHKNEIQPVQKEDSKNQVVEKSINKFITHKSQFLTPERKTHAFFNSKYKSAQQQITQNKQKQNNFNIENQSCIYKYKSQLNSTYREQQNFPLVVNATSINISPYTSPNKNQDQQKRMILQLEKDLMKLEKEHKSIRNKKINKLYPYFLKNNKKSSQQIVYSIYSTNLRKIIS